MVMHPSKKTFSSKMEWTTDTCKNLDKSQTYCCVKEASVQKLHSLSFHAHYSLKKTNHSNEKQISDHQRFRVGEACNHKGIG